MLDAFWRGALFGGLVMLAVVCVGWWVADVLAERRRRVSAGGFRYPLRAAPEPRQESAREYAGKIAQIVTQTPSEQYDPRTISRESLRSAPQEHTEGSAG